MRRLCFSLCFAIILAIPFPARAQSDVVPPLPLPADPQQKAQPADSKSQEAPIPKGDAAKPDYSQEAFVVEQYRSLYRFENDGTGRKETIARIRVQSEAGVQQWGQVQVGYTPPTNASRFPTSA